MTNLLLRYFPIAAVLVALVPACGGGPDSSGSPSQDAQAVDAPVGPLQDARSEADATGGQDASPEAGQDASADVAAQDVAAPDAVGEAASDAADDETVPDASLDSPLDTSWEASSDAAEDVAADAPQTDAGDGGPSVHVSVLTQHNDAQRTGANLSESVLTTANVNDAQFGKLFCWAVDDEVYTQPLLVTDVNVPGAGTRDVVYVGTMNDSVYAFDANDTAASTPLWSRSFLSPGVVPVRNTDMTGACNGHYTDVSGNIGIMGTPAIDPATQTMYLIARTKENGGATFVQRLHALDITDGSERPGSPTVIAATVAGTGEGGSTVVFDPMKQNQRAALLLAGGVVYVGWSSHCDWGPFHGWLMGYDAHTLQQVSVYNTTPDGQGGGIWMSGQGPATDTSGSIYLSTGNGTVGAGNDPTSLRNRSQSYLRLTPSSPAFTVGSWFTPHDYQLMNDSDWDLGSAGILLVPDTNLAVSGGKSSKLFAVDRTTMGGFTPGSEPSAVQTVSLGAQHLHGSPVYWNGPGGPLIYTWAEYDHLKSFRLDAAASRFDPVPLATSVDPAPDGMPGGSLSISSNGNTEGTGILWAYMPQVGDANQMVVPGEMRAFDAANIGVELWNSEQNGARDRPGNYGKYTSPTVANGRVYLATFSDAVCVYGQLPNVQPLGAPTGLTASATTKTAATLQWTAGSTTEAGFGIERKEGNLGFAQIATAPTGATSYVDTTALPFASYSYRVRALGMPAPSAYSNTASIVMNAGAPAPRLRVTDSLGHAILAGNPPSWTTSTDYGASALGGHVSHTFTIANTGDAPLNLTGGVTITGTNAADFVVDAAPPATLAPGASSTFAVAFAPATIGNKTAAVQIGSDDPDQSVFTFGIGGVAYGDLVGYWALDETSGQTAADSSGQGNTGTATGVTWGAAGHVGGAGSFDGQTSDIVVADNASLDPTALSVAAWIDPMDWNGNRRILQKGKFDDQYRLTAEDGVLKFDVAGVGTVTTALPATGVWTHIAGTYDGATLAIYTNGTLAASIAATGPVTQTADPITIGAKTAHSAGGDRFYGLLDEVRLYTRALTAAEVATLAH